MRILVTGSSGHLGEALMRQLPQAGISVIGWDIKPSPFTDVVASITDRDRLKGSLTGVDAVLHTATLHKPHVATHARQAFIDTNITGTLALLEEAVAAGVGSFVFTSTTSVFGRALVPAAGQPAAWITEDVRPVPKNIYGVTKAAAEDLCELAYLRDRLPCVVLRTSRFFPEEDDSRKVRDEYADSNAKANEYLHRRVDVQDVVDAHLLAVQRAGTIGFGRFIVSATTPFTPDDLAALRNDAPSVVERYLPDYQAEYARRAWRMFPSIDRVYVNDLARKSLGWQPRYDFKHVVESLRNDIDYRSPLAITIGAKGYHAERFAQGPYPVI